MAMQNNKDFITRKVKGVLGENPFDFNIRFFKYLTNNKEIWAKRFNCKLSIKLINAKLYMQIVCQLIHQTQIDDKRLKMLGIPTE